MVLKMRKRNERTSQFLGQMKKLYGDSLSFPDLNYRNQRSKITVRCNLHNVEYQAWPTNLSSGKRGCPRCGKKLTIEDFIIKARKRHGVKYSYDKVSFVNTMTKVTITCPIHGDWRTKPYIHYHVGSECPKCVADSNRMTADKFIGKAKAIHGDRYDYSNVVISKRTDVVSIGCPIHGNLNSWHEHTLQEIDAGNVRWRGPKAI